MDAVDGNAIGGLLREVFDAEMTTTVSVCVAALPPMPATIGMNTASAVTCSMVPSKSATTDAATNAVTRLIASHGRRFRSDSAAGVAMRSRIAW